MSTEAEWSDQVKSFLNQKPAVKAEATPQAEDVRASTLIAPVTTNVAATRIGAIATTRPALTAVLATPIAARPASIELLRPQWNIVALPYIAIDPAYIEKDPIRTGEFLLWPDPDVAVPEMPKRNGNGGNGGNGGVPIHPHPIPKPPIVPRPIPLQRAFFALAVPQLLNFSLTAQVTVQVDNSIKLTGGTAILTVGVYAQDELQLVENNRQAWTGALSQAGYTNRIWKFIPQNLRNLQAALDLPPEHKGGGPQISTNTNAGTATFVILLSEAGVLVWKSALEQRNGSSIPGICRLAASYYGRAQNQVNAKDQALDVPLGQLLVNRGPQDVHTINPQEAVESTLLVIGNDFIQNVAVTLHPSVGQAPETQVFGQAGGQIKISITTQDVGSVEVDWTAQVTFTPTGWPVIPDSGKLSATEGWTKIVKPDSWIATYAFMAILVDNDGKPVPISSAGTNYHVNGVMTFTAPYLANLLRSSFDASHQLPLTIALPRFPGQPFGDLVLNVFATRDGLANTQSRKISATESYIVAMIHPDAQIDIKTSADALSELSMESEMVALLAMLK